MSRTGLLPRSVWTLTGARMSDKNFTLILFALASLLAVVSTADDGHCVWYGECNTNQNGLKQNCPYNGEAKPLGEEGQKLLSTWCSDLAVDTGSGVRTCCSSDQLITLNNNVVLVANLLERCPSCINNLVKHICQFTCSPRQSTFINVTRVITTPKNVSYVDAISAYVTNTYLEGTYNSCSKVSVPSTGLLALDMMCGKLGASRCSPKKWFEFMGGASEDNPYVPFQITYNATDVPVDGYTPLNVTVTPCSQGYKDSPACSCVDCDQSCPVPPPASPSSKHS